MRVLAQTRQRKPIGQLSNRTMEITMCKDEPSQLQTNNKAAANMCFDEGVAASHRWKRVTYRKFSATYEF